MGIAGTIAHHVGLGLNGKPDTAVAVILFGPVLLASISSLLAVLAHYERLGKHSVPADGAAKVIAGYAALLLVGLTAIQIWNS
jgi:hypothetical protein